jgi:ATP phosphoribosyltransferase
LRATFAADRQRFDGLEEMSQFVDAYRQLGQRRVADEETYVLVFALLLCSTIVAGVWVASLTVRSVVTRLTELSQATARVGAGDLSVRVSEQGSDEVTDLGRGFNRMLSEVEQSRHRIEYLGRIAAWQEMARRITRDFFADKGVHVDLIRLYGSMELAPIMGLADAIVDLESTGKTLKANKLVAVEEIQPVSARLIVNQAALKTRRAELQPLIDAFAKAARP